MKTSIGTLRRVLGVVDWNAISKGNADAWLYFYEDFLNVYDKELRKQTGSYYTPPEVVREMVRLVDDILRDRFERNGGLASNDVTIADPAVGTGTFLLGVLERIAATVDKSQGPGAVPAKIEEAVKRLIAFELQLGPFAVAQLRLMAEVGRLLSGGETPKTAEALSLVPHLQMFVTDTLGNPYDEVHEWVPQAFQYQAISESRRQANHIKREVPIHVVLGNPPYKDKAKGRGGWVESGQENAEDKGPLADWIPPIDWGVGEHSKHLRNLYVYFWRWATWKVFDQLKEQHGIVCFITVAGFLNGPGFQRMRDYLRRTASELWVIDCSPEGHQPEVPTRIFQGVQQPVCIVIASRSAKKDPSLPAAVHFRALPKGRREEKFAALKTIGIDAGWQAAPDDWRAPFFPAATGAWSMFVPLTKLFMWDGAGPMPGRTWVIAPDAQSLKDRWNRLVAETDPEKKEALFHPHLLGGEPGDKHIRKKVTSGLAGHEFRTTNILEDKGSSIEPVRYAFRSFDRQWIVPDARVINRPNPELWRMWSKKQVHLTALDRTAPSNGPAITITGLIPDHDHFKGSFSGRVMPLWRDADATHSNVLPTFTNELTKQYGESVSGEDVFAYVAALLAHPAFTAKFQEDLKQPGLRVPFTADPKLFREAAELGRKVVWLHTYGERFVDANKGRPAGPPRLPKDTMPVILKAGAIPTTRDGMPDTLDYDPVLHQLKVGTGYVDRVPKAVWEYEVSGKQVLKQWFSYRKKDRERPLIGERRPPSKLGEIQPDHWLAEYTTDLMDLLNALGLLVELEPKQKDVLDRILSGRLLATADLDQAGAFVVPPESKKTKSSAQTTFF